MQPASRNQIGARVRAARGDRTQADLAKAAAQKGYNLTVSDISRVENGADIGLEKFGALADVLGVTADHLLCRPERRLRPVWTDEEREAKSPGGSDEGPPGRLPDDSADDASFGPGRRPRTG